jgi:hypothetical protein
MRDLSRVNWNKNQKLLRLGFEKGTDLHGTIHLFMEQHALVHASDVSVVSFSTFEDEIWDGLPYEAAVHVPGKELHSIAWCIWHITRCEDITMNILIAGESQVLDRGRWVGSLGILQHDTGNAMGQNEMLDFNSRINICELTAYRLAVGRQTREIVNGLHLEDVKRKTDPQGLERILDVGAVLPSEKWLLDYWGSLTIAGLLLMPPTRHSFIHLNEAIKIRNRVMKLIH